MRKRESGITLIALIITVVILIILVAVTIYTITKTDMIENAIRLGRKL